jgi:hypothetical protein
MRVLRSSRIYATEKSLLLRPPTRRRVAPEVVLRSVHSSIR